MIEATLENFDAEVVQASMTLPVLVDFWAPWCAPCKSLGPILEKLEVDYGGRFKLVKIDSDAQPQLSSAFGVRSIPTCVLMVGGQPADGFTGALPESKVREFLDKHVPPAAAEPEAPEELPAMVPGSADAIAVLREAVAQAPDNDDVRFELLCSLLQAGLDDDAKVVLAPVMPKISTHRKFDAAQRILNATDNATDSIAARADITAYKADLTTKIATNKRDFDARFSLAQLHIAQRQWTHAMDELLEILMRDKAWADEKARKTYIAILDVIEPPKVKVADGHIPPQDPTVATYRRRLSSVVLS
jgi:putative thioredoxin